MTTERIRIPDPEHEGLVWVTREEASWLTARMDVERVLREVADLYDEAMEDKRASDFVFAFNDNGLTYGTMRLARAILATEAMHSASDPTSIPMSDMEAGNG